MYARFYDTGKKPFGLSPSSLSLYLGETHREALAFLTYCVVEKEGLALVTGEAGTGKTTIARALIQNMEDDAELIYLSNPTLTAGEFYDYLGSSLFKRRIHYPSKAVFLLEFEKFFRRCRKERKNIVLLIDDAQALSFELLEEIRLLSNMESMEAGKYINIILLGQPDRTEKLNEVRCRPLLQRIGLRHHIRPLKLANSREYIATRLKIAGAADKATEVFTKRALEAIGEYSRGPSPDDQHTGPKFHVPLPIEGQKEGDRDYGRGMPAPIGFSRAKPARRRKPDRIPICQTNRIRKNRRPSQVRLVALGGPRTAASDRGFMGQQLSAVAAALASFEAIGAFRTNAG